MVKMVAQREGVEPLWQYGIGSLDVLPPLPKAEGANPSNGLTVEHPSKGR